MLEREKVEASIKVVNVVASAALGQRVNLRSIIKGFPSARYPSKQFPGIVYRLRKPKTAALIFNSGKIICTGGKTEVEAHDAIEHIVNMLAKRRIIVSGKLKFKVNNIVASANLGRAIDLASISTWQKTIYEPEQFPALIYRMENPKVVFLIFSSGRAICLGAKTEAEVQEAVRKLIQKLKFGGAFRSPIINETEIRRQEGVMESVLTFKLRLSDFAISDSLGKACIYVEGLWCKNRSCSGPQCKFANLIQRKLVNGAYGCWGFHWQEKWYTEETKKAQRKFFD